MRKFPRQRRVINKPCCNEKTTIEWPRGWIKARFYCQTCDKHYIIHFSIDNTGKSHKVIRKEIEGV